MARFIIETDRGKFEIEADGQPTAEQLQQAAQDFTANQAGAPQSKASVGSVMSAMADVPMAGFPALNQIKAAGPAIADMGLEGGGAAAGQAVGAMGGFAAPVTVPVGGAIGGSVGNALAQLRQLYMGERKDFSVGEFIAAGAMGSVPGVSLAKAPMREIAGAVGKNVAGNLAAKTIQEGVDEGRAITPGEAGMAVIGAGLGVAGGRALDTGAALNAATKAKIANAVEDETIKLVTAAGYRINPARVKPGAVVSALEYLGGKSATANDFAKLNADVTLDLAKKAIGVEAGQSLNKKAFQEIKDKANAVYGKVSNISPRAQEALNKYRKAREYSQTLYRSADSPLAPHPIEAKEQAEKWADKADVYWRVLETEATRVKRPDLMTELEAAKKTLSKVHVVEEAYNMGSGRVSADIVSKASERRGTFLDGELETIHRMAQAFPMDIRKTEAMTQGGIIFNRLTTLAALGATGYYAGAPTAAAVAGLAVGAPVAARSIMRNPRINRAMLNRLYGPGMGQDLGALAVQQAGASAGRQEPPQSVRRFIIGGQ